MKRLSTSFLLVALACTFGLLGGGIVMYVRSALASRSSSGSYSLATSPVVGGQSIGSSLWNNTFSDLASSMTDSLDRNGRGGMLAALRGIDGTVAAPALSYTSETGSGEYRIGAGDLGWAILGGKQLELTGSLFTVVGTARFANGLVSAPALSFTNDTGSGLYRIGSNDIGFAINGVKVQEWNADTTTTKIGDKLSLWGSTPTIGFNMYNNGSNRYMTTNIAAALTMDLTNGLIFYSAPSASADSVATLTERMRVNASGVAIGSSQQFTVDGSGNVVSTATLKMASAGTAVTQINFGACTLNSGTPATCTATVNANSKCTANVVTTTAANTRDLGVTVSGTTLTITSQTNGDAWQVNYICLG